MDPTSIDILFAKKLHELWRGGGTISQSMKEALISAARRNGWPVPAHAAGMAKMQGFNVSGLVTK